MFSASLDEIIAKASKNSTLTHTLDSPMEDGVFKASFHKNTNNHN